MSSTFSTDVRFVGAGAIAIAAIWTLLKILGPIVSGIKAAAASTRARRGGGQVELIERDLPIWIVGGTIVASLIPIGLLLWWFLDSTQVTGNKPLIIGVTLVFVVLIGALLASVAGYMAGLIGSSNSPISGLGILVVIIASLVLVLVHGRSDDAAQTLGLVAYALFATAVVFGIATISNDNLQDLKTGQLVGATPWKQQVALVIGVIFGGLVIAPVLDLLNGAFGFAGAPGAGRKCVGGTAGGVDLVAREGRLRWRPELETAGPRCRHRCGGHPDRRGAEAHDEVRPAAAGGRDGHVPADVADPRHPHRRATGPVLRQVGRPHRRRDEVSSRRSDSGC